MKKQRKASTYSLVNNVIAALKLYWQINRYRLVLYLLLAGLQVATSIGSLYFASRIIGQLTSFIQHGTIDTHHLYVLLAASSGMVIGERFAWRWLNFAERRTWINFYQYITVAYNAAVSQLDMPQHHDPKLEKKLTKLREQYQYAPANFANSTLQLIHASMRLMSTLVVVIIFAPLLVPIMLISLLPGLITEQKLSQMQWAIWDKRGDEARFAWRTGDYLQDKNKLQETKIFGTRSYLLGYLKNMYGTFYKEQLTNLRKVQRPAALSLLSEGVVLIAINIWLLQKVLYHGFSIASFSFYSGIVTQFGSSLGLIVNSIAFLYDLNGYMKDFFKLMDTKPILPVSKDPVSLDATQIPSVRFDNVSFKYPSSDTWILRNVSFDIKAGDKVAFVGENGAGKTTIIRLLLRFYDVTEGTIYINNTDIRELDLPAYYQHIGVLFQNFNDYPYPVRDNIALGRVEDFDNDERVVSSAKLANADSFIQKYPKKYQQLLEVGFKDGLEPSGGQWQRIALARALFRDAGILILDEPTAAVDAKSEYAIFKTLAEHSAHKTTIIISHRFSTVRNANKIFVIENGTVLENGSHTELMKIKGGVYKDMFDKQAEGYR